MTAAWPGTLPDAPLVEGFKETLPKVVLRTAMDTGAAKQRRRYSAAPRAFTANFSLTTTQAATFDTFYVTTLEGGALQFTWTHPRTGAAANFRFTAEPEITSQGGIHYLAACQIEQMP